MQEIKEVEEFEELSVSTSVELEPEVLAEKIAKKQAKIAIVGLGYVGLPTAAIFADFGFQVTGLDINPRIINGVNNDCLETKEVGLEKLVKNARKKGLISATDVASEALTSADVVIACVQTPVDSQGYANLAFLQSACEGIAHNLTRNKLIIIQSTVPPKTIESLVLPTLERISGLLCGTDFWLAYCPERLAPGNGLDDLMMNSRLIGAYNKESALLSKTLFETVSKGQLLITDIGSAEISKLAENTFRFVNIAYANELARLCKQIGVDVKEVIKLANTHPRVNIHQPGPGAGGPCLTKDSKMLLNTALSKTFKPSIIPAAIKINTDMPRYIADLAIGSLRNIGKNPSECKVVVFGTAYKGDVDDSRDSPSGIIISTLKENNVPVFVFDPICKDTFGATRMKNLDEAVRSADCIIIATDHQLFFNLNLLEICTMMNKNPIIIDPKRIISPTNAVALGYDYVTISRPLS